MSLEEKPSVDQYVLLPGHGIMARVDNVLRVLTPQEAALAQLMCLHCLNSGWTVGEIGLLMASNPKPRVS